MTNPVLDGMFVARYLGMGDSGFQFRRIYLRFYKRGYFGHNDCLEEMVSRWFIE